jgi:hypothetical protein
MASGSPKDAQKKSPTNAQNPEYDRDEKENEKETTNILESSKETTQK